MSEQLALGITALAMVLGYIALNFYLAARLADWVASFWRKDTDEEIAHQGWDTDRKAFVAVTRGEMRWRCCMFLVAMPLFAYLNYEFFDVVSAGFDHTFKAAGAVIVKLFYQSGG